MRNLTLHKFSFTINNIKCVFFSHQKTCYRFFSWIIDERAWNLVLNVSRASVLNLRRRITFSLSPMPVENQLFATHRPSGCVAPDVERQKDVGIPCPSRWWHVVSISVRQATNNWTNSLPNTLLFEENNSWYRCSWVGFYKRTNLFLHWGSITHQLDCIIKVVNSIPYRISLQIFYKCYYVCPELLTPSFPDSFCSRERAIAAFIRKRLTW